MQYNFLSRVTGVLILLSLLLLPNSPTPIALAEPVAGPDDELIYIDSGNFIRVIDPNVENGTQEIIWSSPDGNWFDFATGDFNNDGDKEIVAIGGGKLTVFDPVVRDSTIVPDGTSNLVPWVRLHERSLPNADIIGAGNLDQNVPGDEIVVGYNVSEANGINYRVDVLKTGDGGRTWLTHISQGYGAKWTYIKVGNINNAGSDDLLLGRTTAFDSLVEAHEVDNNFATIYSRGDSTLFTQRDGAIGQIYGGGTGETVLMRSFNGTTEAPVMLIYQFFNGAWQIVEDSNNGEGDDSAHYFPHPYKVVTGDVTGNGDDEIFWLRDAPAGNTTTVRLVMVNRGSDVLPAFETPLASDNGYRTLATGDPDGDSRDEVAIMRSDRIVVFTTVESGNTALTQEYPNKLTNNRSLGFANLDGNGFVAGARFSASPTSLSATLISGTKDNSSVLSIQLTNIGSGGNLPFSVSKENGSAWFNFSLGANTTPASIFVSQFDASTLAPGVYKDRLKITSSNTSVLNQPFYIPIELTVTAASFSLAPTSFALAFADSATLTQTQSIAVNGLPGLTFSAAVLSQPEFNAAAAALGTQPTQAHFAESGALILGNGVDDYSTSISRSAVEAQAASANSWPSAFPWISASSPTVTVEGTVTVAISPTLMSDSVSKGVLLVLADDRAGAFPDNLKIAEFVVVKSIASLFLPSIHR